MLDNTYGSLFHFFSLREMAGRFDSEIYSSADVRTSFLDDKGGKLIKKSSLCKDL